MRAESERILVLAPTSRDRELACQELAEAGLEAESSDSMASLVAGIEAGAGAVLLTEEILTEAGHLLGSALSRQPPWSDLPLLVLGSRSRRGRGESENLRSFGNVTLLDPPLRVRTMVRAAESALRGRRRQYAAARAIHERDRFLAMLGHELRNPLSAIRLALEVSRAKNSEPTRETAVMERQVQHLNRLVNDLLDVARVTSGKIELQESRLDLRALLRGCVELARPAFEAGGVGLSAELGEDPVQIRGDRVRLEQVVGNILTNALKYTPRGGEARLRLEAGRGSASIVIEDTGSGISEEVLPRVFDVFAQADETLARSRGGMGVGLTLVRTLVELHRGTVRAESEGLDRGSRFTVTLPVLAPEEVTDAGAPARRPDGPSRQILLVDDHVDALELLAEALSGFGHQVATAADGASGLELLLRRRPDVAIVDIGLPDIDGFEVARRVRRELEDGPLLIALTGYGQPDDRARAHAAGFDAHLTKPADLRALRDLVEGRRRGSRGSARAD